MGDISNKVDRCWESILLGAWDHTTKIDSSLDACLHTGTSRVIWQGLCFVNLVPACPSVHRDAAPRPDLYRINLLSTLLSLSLGFFSLYESSSCVSSVARIRRYSFFFVLLAKCSIDTVISFRCFNIEMIVLEQLLCIHALARYQNETPETLLSQIRLSCQGKPSLIV